MLQIKLLSSLPKVFSDAAPVAEPLRTISMLCNERLSFQVALCSDREITLQPEVGGVFAPCAALSQVFELPSEYPVREDSDDYYLRREPGLFPDLLRPVTGNMTLRAGKWESLWVELDPNGAVPTGEHIVTVRFLQDGNELAEAELDVTVIAVALPEQSLICTNWFYCDCLSDFYGVPVFSEEHWRIVENFIKTAAHHGINMILTPLFTPALDTAVGAQRPTVQLVDVTYDGKQYQFGFEKLTRWVEMCDRCGVTYFELSHLYTQWGAKNAPKIMATVNGEEKRIFGWETRANGKAYKAFLTEFAAALMQYLEEHGIKERCYVHVSDEPSLLQYRSYKMKANFIEQLFPGVKSFDALSDFKFYEKKACKIPVPSNDHAEQFVGRVPEFWVYYCCGQHKDYVSNRFFAMPSARTRVLGFQMYQAQAKGFLQWGYNFYNTQLSKEKISPFQVTDSGKAFPSGDGFVVYPGEGGQALCSLRLKTCYEAYQDQRALQLLESLIGRERTEQLLNAGLEHPITFKQYPHGDAWLLQTRQRINEAIAQAVE